MEFTGVWKFHSIGTFNDDNELVYMSADEYLNRDMPYIDTDDEEAVADEIRERKTTVGTVMKVCDDGKVYMLAPLPEGVTDEEVAEAVKAGEITLMDGMIKGGEGLPWELRDGEFWVDFGFDCEIFDEKADSFAKPIDDKGFFNFINIRFVKA